MLHIVGVRYKSHHVVFSDVRGVQARWQNHVGDPATVGIKHTPTRAGTATSVTSPKREVELDRVAPDPQVANPVREHGAVRGVCIGESRTVHMLTEVGRP
jgi:hypothetical protein